MTHVGSSGSHQQKRSIECAAADKAAPYAYPCVKHSHCLNLLCRTQHLSGSHPPWTLHPIAVRKHCQANLDMSWLLWPIIWAVEAVVTAQPTVGQLWTGSGTHAMTAQSNAAATKKNPQSCLTCCSTSMWSRLQECCSVCAVHVAAELTAWVVVLY